MAHTFGTTVDMSHFVEVPDPAVPGQPKRPGVGQVLTLRDAFTDVVVGTATTQALGYWGAVLNVPAIDVSADGGVSWVGPVWSAEAQQTGWTAGPYAATAAASATSAAAAATQARDLALAAQTAAADALSAAQNIEANQDAPTEAVVNTILTDPASTARGSLDTHFDSRYDARYGAMFDRKSRTHSSDYATLQAALDATPAGGVCFIPPGTYSPSATLVWPSGVTIEGDGQVTITMAAARNDAILTMPAGATGNRLRGVRLLGTYTPGTQAGAGQQCGISVLTSTAANPVRGLQVTDCVLENIHGFGIRVKHCVDFLIADNRLVQYGYAGVGLYSAIRGRIKDNTFEGTGLLPIGELNSYGAFCSSFEPDGPIGSAENPHSEGVIYSGNIIRNQAWEGLDVHSGIRCSFVVNQFFDCAGNAIAIVGSGQGNLRESDECIVADNIIIGRADHTSASGIRFRGKSPSAGAGYVPIKGTVTGNYVSRCGDSDESNTAGIVVANGLGVVVANNSLVECRSQAVLMQDSPGSVVQGNTIIDVWQAAGTSEAVFVWQVSLAATDVTIVGNRMLRGSLVAGADGVPAGALINHAGYNALSQTLTQNVTVYEDGNVWPAGTVFGTVQAQSRSGLRGTREVNGTAPPTTGAWVRGDRIRAFPPVAGQPIGWVCVTGGTPGTWKDYGAISA